MSEWISKPLNQLASFQKGRKVETSEHPLDGFEPYLGASAISGTIEEYGDPRLGVMAGANDVLMLWDGERSGLVGRTKTSGVISSTMVRLTSKGEIAGDYLYYSLNLKFEWIQNRRTGTGVPHVPKDLGRILSVPFPKNPEEQRRIAEILTTVDEAMEQTEALVAKLQQMKAGLMHDLFTRGVTPDGHLRPTRQEAPHLYHQTPLGWLPKEWSPGHLRDYLDPISGIKPGPFGSSLTKDIYTSSGYRIYGQEQVIAGSLEVGDYYISAAKFAEMRMFEVQEGDILLSLVGTVGCVLVLEPPFEPGIINPRLMRLRPLQGRTVPQFIRHLLLTSDIRRQIDSLAGGGTMPVINGKVIRRLRTPLIESKEQKRIVQRIAAVESKIEISSAHLAKLRQQKQGLMQDLLTGRVRVKVIKDILHD